MTTAIIQYDNRPASKLGKLIHIVKQNQDYADLHGYEYFFVEKIDRDLPPYWVKPFLIEYYLSTRYDTVLWLDTDAVVHDFHKPIEHLFDGTAAFVYAPDMPLWKSPFNAGVFACTKAALPLLCDWCALYPADMWEKDEHGAWRHTHGAWAGPAFEQQVFVDTILPEYAGTGLLRALPWQTLQSPFPLKESFSVHFAAHYKWNVPVYLAARDESKTEAVAQDIEQEIGRLLQD